MTVSIDPARVRGTHGRRGPGTDIAWAASFPIAPEPGSLIDLARAVKERLGESL